MTTCANLGSEDGASTISLSRDTVTHALAGCVSGTLVDIVVYPLNTIKTRKQIISSFSEKRAWHRVMYTSNLYAGVSTVLMSAPAFGVYMAAYEASKSLMKTQMSRVDSPQEGMTTTTHEARVNVLGEACSGCVTSSRV